LDAEVDFKTSMINANVTHTLNVLDRTSQLILDTMNLDIKNAWHVTEDAMKKKSYKTLNFIVSQPNKNLGSVVQIQFTEAVQSGTTQMVMVEYSTSPEAIGLNWLTKEQTNTKTLPYLFSQCEPIYCRSIAPL